VWCLRPALQQPLRQQLHLLLLVVHCRQAGLLLPLLHPSRCCRQ
jgi:hypothetical protein